MEHQPSPSPGKPPRRWPLFLIGVACFVLGPLIYFAQLRSGLLVLPWHLPVLATLGALVMAASARQRPGVLRVVGLAAFSLLCGLEWFVFGVATRTPAYIGPAQVGTKLPAFAATYADGRPFTDKTLEDGGRTVLIFFRGRW